MAESFGLCQIVSCSADRGELKSLSPLVVEKRNLLIVGPAHPAAGHDIRHRPNAGIVDVVMGRNGDFLLFLLIARNIGEHAVAARGNPGSVSIGKQSGSPEARS